MSVEDSGFIQFYLRRLSRRGGCLGFALCSLFKSRMMSSSIATNAHVRNQISKLNGLCVTSERCNYQHQYRSN